MLQARQRLPALSRAVAPPRAAGRMLAARVLPNAQPCALVADAQPRRFMQSTDEATWPALRAVLQQAPRTDRHGVGRKVSIMPGEHGALPHCLLPLCRAQPRACGNRHAPKLLSVVQLCGEYR